ncbi:MAG: EscU/YscU/HrcU family type III secretion system export apparatus switch protein [Clostridiales Family XIII bacterium]|jgi:flagellar biosynthesis protein|nr:EscU/YscU/HrcU family type III secretion system export apparatus switch protein [Clostridiales Family XIII bacterium]
MSEYEKTPELRAAALQYDTEQDRAPHVVAAGSGYVAQRILQVAMENGIAIYHDDSAATMLAKLDIGKEIPPELYQIVVNIYISLLDAADRRHNPKKPAKNTAPAPPEEGDGGDESGGARKLDIRIGEDT